MLITSLVAAGLVVVYRVVCIWENRRRDKAGTTEGFDHAYEDDLTDRKVSARRPEVGEMLRADSVAEPAIPVYPLIRDCVVWGVWVEKGYYGFKSTEPEGCSGPNGKGLEMACRRVFVSRLAGLESEAEDNKNPFGNVFAIPLDCGTVSMLQGSEPLFSFNMVV